MHSSATIARRMAIAAAGCGALLPRPAEAGDITLEQFGIKQGSRIAPSKAEQEAAIKAIEDAYNEAVSTPFPEAAQKALSELEKVDPMLKQGKLDDVRDLLSGPRMKIMGIRFSPGKRNNPPQGAWEACKEGSKCGAALTDLLISLEQLEEYCFENRIEFYNSVDQKQVEERAKTAQIKVMQNIQEPLDYAKEAREQLAVLMKKI